MPATTVPFQPHPADCCHVCCSGYYRTEVITNAPKPDDDFVNGSIHPIFSLSNLPCDSKLLHAALKQAMRLGTLLIEKASLPFWYSVLFGETVVLRQASALAGKQIMFVKEKKILTAEEVTRTRTFLRGLAPRFQFDLDEGPSASSGCGVKRHLKTGELHAFISLNGELYEALEQAYWAHTDYKDPALSCWLQLRGAINLCHEVAHAVVLLIHDDEGEGRLQAFFEGSQVAEEGFEWEKRTFGGIFELTRPVKAVTDTGLPCYRVDGAPSAVSGMIVLDDWPNALTVADYRKRGDPITLRGHLPAVHIRWNTSMLFCMSLLQTSWWSSEYALAGPRATQSEKKTGHRFTPKSGTDEIQGYNVDDGGGIIRTVPRCYVVTEKGLVMRTAGPKPAALTSNVRVASRREERNCSCGSLHCKHRA